MTIESQKVLEQKLIGGILITPTGFSKVASTLRSEMFQDKTHQKIFSEMANLFASQRPVKRPLVAHGLGSEVDGITTDAILSALEQTALAEETIFFDEYSWSIRESWVKRSAGDFFKQVSDTIQKPGVAADEVLARAMAKLELFSANSDETKTISLHDALDGYVSKLAQRLKDGTSYGYSTGIEYMHDLIGDFVPGQYIIIGAGTKTGKTSMAADVGLGLARYGTVLCFSPEMTPFDLAARKAASETGITTSKQRSKDLSSFEYEKLEAVKNKIDGAKNFQIISKKMDIDQICEEAKRQKAKTGELVAIIVDHLGILNPLKGGGRKDYEVAAEASPKMKDIAEELNCVAIGLSQLNKETPYGRTIQDKINFLSRPPTYHDLKGAIANDADHVIMPYRKEALLSNIEPAKDTEDYFIWESAMNRCKGKADVRLALSRWEPYPKTIPLYWVGERTRFESMRQPNDKYSEDLF